jgi:4-hydroxy-tetrahydrodipicolinate synthase
MSLKTSWLRGVFPALVTPFDRNSGAVDEEAYRRIIRRCLPHVDGLLTSGTTGEFCYLSRWEQKRLVEIAVEEAQEKPVLAGCGASGTKQALALTKDAQQAGATGALVVTPFFLHPSDKGVYQHFHDIATNVDFPLILYNIPQVVDRYLSCAVVRTLADLPNVVGIKDSSGNLTYTMEILQSVGDKIAVMIGHDEVTCLALCGGARGCILASAQVYPEVWRTVFQHIQEGEIEHARDEQMRVQTLSRIFCRHGGGVAIKAALNILGLNVGEPRLPLRPVGGALTDDIYNDLQSELKALVGKRAGSGIVKPAVYSDMGYKPLAITPDLLADDEIFVGSGTAGEGNVEVGIDLIIGCKSGPIGEQIASQLTQPSSGQKTKLISLERGSPVCITVLLMFKSSDESSTQLKRVYDAAIPALERSLLDIGHENTADAKIANDWAYIILMSADPRLYGSPSLSEFIHQAMCEALDTALTTE